MGWLSVFSMDGPAARLTVALDKCAYTAGELVRGRVTLAVFHEMTGNELVVRFRGEERISWVELVSEGGGGDHHNESSHQKRKKRTKSNVFLNDEVLVFAFPRVFAVGNYEFPFAYQSHASLPGVFAMDQQQQHPDKKNIRDLHATITYNVRTTLDEGYWFDCWNARAGCTLVLHEQPKTGLQHGYSNHSGSYDTTSQSVQLFSLLDQGKCELAASLGKSIYRSGESAKLQYHVKNASLMPIRALKVTLYQDIYLQLRKRRDCEPISCRVAKLEFAGAASESEVHDFVSLALRSSDGRELSPSTNGALIKCRYHVRVQCDIRWCPDPFINLPLVITATATETPADAQYREAKRGMLANITKKEAKPHNCNEIEMELKDLAPLLLKKERAGGDVEPAVLTPLLRGSAQLNARRRRLEALVATHPVLSQRDFVFQNHAQRYNSALKKMFYYVQLLQEHDITDPVDQQMLYVAIGERLPIDVHRAMFIPTLENQADAQQQRLWLPLARSYKIFGAYAQTELGHGSNVQGLETIATFDVAAQQFVIDSPTLTSRKWWPGGLGKTATHAIIHARLFLDNGGGNTKDVGIQAFIVPLRSLATHEPLPGVELGDIGPKVGFNSVDNGYAVFHKVRIPRENMLMKYAQVLVDGSFVKPKSDKLVYLTMVQVRSYLILKFGYIIGSAATITTRFSAARVQGGAQPGAHNKGELQVLDYQNQQHALFPYVALSYAATFAGKAMNAMHDSALATIKSGTGAFEAKLAELHAVSSGLKAWLADAVGVGIEALRRLCGGHGFTQSSNLAHIFAEIVGASTFEGTFDVLVQQHARFLVKTAVSIGEDHERLLLRATCRAKTAEDFGDLVILLEAFKVRATRATLDLVNAMKSEPESSDGNGSNPHMVLMTKASVANSEFALLKAFVQGVDTVPTTETRSNSGNATKEAVANLCALFGVWLLVKSLGEFREADYLSSQQGEFAREQLVRLLPLVRKNAVLLTDAWDFSDFELNSTIGRYDGDMYRALVERAKDEPLNRTQVAESYEKYLKPLIQSGL